MMSILSMAPDAAAHDRLICLNTGKDLDDPTGCAIPGRNTSRPQRNAFPLFRYSPGAGKHHGNCRENRIYELNSLPIMPDFPIPEGFSNEDEYLKHLSYEGAKNRYKIITDEIRERIDLNFQC
jgi:DNA polymerase III subunit alpha